MKKTKTAAALLALVAGMLPSLALAAGPSFFTPVEGDISIRILGEIFGEMIKAGAVSPLASTLGVINGALVTVAGLLVFYSMVIAVSSSAMDGSFMGRRLSSLWVPVRLTLGIGLLFPMSSGMNVAQLLIGWMAVQSIGLADATWSKYASTVFTDKPAMTFSRVPQIEALAAGMMRSLVCYEGLLEINASGATAGAEAVVGQPQAVGGYEPKGNRKWGTQELPTLCGGVSGPVFNPTAFRGVSGDFQSRVMGDSASRGALIVQAHSTATAQLEADLQPIAARLVKGVVSEGDRGLYLQAISRYEQTVSQVAREQLGSASYWESLKESATRDGWVTAGSFYLRLASVTGFVQGAYGSTGKASPVEKAPNEAIDSSLRRYLAAIQGAIGGSGRTTTGIDNAYKIDQEQKNSESSLALATINKAADEISDSLVSFASADLANKNPMFLASDVGAGLMATGAMGLGVGALAGFINDGVALFIISIAAVVLGSGVALCYLVPLVPLLVFIGQVVGWVMNLALATVGVSFFALAKVIPSSDEGLAGASKQGYGMMLSILLRPALIVVGFAFGCVIIGPVASFITDVLFATIRLNSGGGISGLFGTVFGVLLYVILLLLTTRFVFKLTQDIPDMALNWAGIAASSISGAQLTQEASKAASAVGAGLGGAAAAGGAGAAKFASKKIAEKANGSGRFANPNLSLTKTQKSDGGEADGELGTEEGGQDAASGSSRFSSSAGLSGASSASSHSGNGSSGSAGEKQSKSADERKGESAARAVAKLGSSVSGHVVDAAVGGGVHTSGFDPVERSLSKPKPGNKKPSTPRSPGAAKGSGVAAAETQAEVEAAEAEAAATEAAAAEAEARAQATAMPEMNGKG